MRVLVVDDEPTLRFALSELLEAVGYEVATAADGAEALTTLEQRPADLLIADLRLPGISGLELLETVRAAHPGTLVVLVTAYGDERLAVQALKAGAYDYIPKPFDNEEMRAVVARAREVLALRAENRRLRLELAPSAHGLIGQAPAMREVHRRIALAAPTDATVFLTGESGTGKELVARAVHAVSPRRDAPFVTLNCAALPADLVEGELFGYVRGAFTGALRDHAGLFEAAHGGTLFLDEVGDLAPAAQAKLLRVLEEGAVRRLGATRPARTDVRIVGATNRRLAERVAAGAFREDLLYRLEIVTIQVPPLRERREDILPLALHFVAQFAARHQRTVRDLGDAARRALVAYDWPGNVRELRNAVERAVVLASGDVLEPADLPAAVTGGPSLAPTEAALAELPYLAARNHATAAFDRAFLAAALERHGGNVSRTARALRIHRQSLQRMMRRLGLAAAVEDADPRPP